MNLHLSVGPKSLILTQLIPLACDEKVELKKQSSCSMQLSNKSDKYVAFKVGVFFAIICLGF